jgi:hypothetical protein
MNSSIKSPRPDCNRTEGNSKNTRKTSRPPARFQDETLEALRARLPDYLEACGVELRRNGNRLVGHCPNHEDRHPSFAVFADGQACGCYPCGFSGDIFKTAQWLGRAGTFPEAVRHVASVLGIHLPGDDESRPRPATAPATPKPRPKPEPPQLTDEQRERIHAARLRFSDAFDDREATIEEIAASLGISNKTLRWAEHGDCGLAIDNPDGHPPWLCYAYPNGLKYRNPGKSGPRFLWLCGRATEPWRMGWARNSAVETVFLTEGESDALALIEAGIEADGKTAVVASPGTSFPHAWAPMFRGKRVVLCFDLDGPGIAAGATVAATLKGHAREILRWKGVGR